MTVFWIWDPFSAPQIHNFRKYTSVIEPKVETEINNYNYKIRNPYLYSFANILSSLPSHLWIAHEQVAGTVEILQTIVRALGFNYEQKHNFLVNKVPKVVTGYCCKIFRRCWKFWENCNEILSVQQQERTISNTNHDSYVIYLWPICNISCDPWYPPSTHMWPTCENHFWPICDLSRDLNMTHL